MEKKLEYKNTEIALALNRRSMIGIKRKSAADQAPLQATNLISSIKKRFRGTADDGKLHSNEHRTSAVFSTIKSSPTTVTSMNNQPRMETDSDIHPSMLAERRQLQYELQCQEALLVLMQKLQSNQQLASASSITTETTKQRPTSITPSKSNHPPPTTTNGTTAMAPVKPASNVSNRSKLPHTNQHTLQRPTNPPQQVTSKSSVAPQSNRQGMAPVLPTSSNRTPAAVVASVTKSATHKPTSNHTVKSTHVSSDQQLLNAKLALRKQLEQTLLQIPSPKPSTCDLTYIPGMNGWSEFLTFIGLEQASGSYTDSIHRRPASETLLQSPYFCAQCGTDWSVTWHDVSSSHADEKILCDRCRKTSQKKILKQDHSNRLRQAFIQALQQEKELDAKFQQQPPVPSIPVSPIKPPSTHQKHSTKSSSAKVHSHSTAHHHPNHPHQPVQPHHHRVKSSSSKSHPMNPFSFEALASLQSNEQLEFLQKHFLSNMIPYAMANQVAAALGTKSTPQQQAFAASLPAMAASLLHQQNPAQYLLDMIPQAGKSQPAHRSK